MYTNWQQYTLALDKVKPLMDKEAKKISMKERRELKAHQQRHTVPNEQQKQELQIDEPDVPAAKPKA